MTAGRPKIKVPYEPFDVIIDLISVTLLILLITYTFMSYSDLPETIATHFNSSGVADGFSKKNTIWWLPVISIALFIGLFIINKYPHIHNYMVNITEENALKNYRFSNRIVRVVNFFSMALFAYIQYKLISGSKGETAELGSWFLSIVIGFSILLPLGIFIYFRTINKT